jgi:hypothetical protein
MSQLNLLKSFSSYFSPFKSEKTMMAIKGGMLVGYMVTYCMINAGRTVTNKVGSAVAEKNPLPIFFTGMLGVAIIESIGLAYEIAKRILGERSFYEQIPYEDLDVLTSLNRCRYRVWKILSWAEQQIELIDIAYSRLFCVRTQSELKARAIPERRWDLMEIVRAAFKEQAEEMLDEPYPANGYTILLLNFALGVTDKINQISHRIQKARLEEKRKLEKERKMAENKVLCTILDAWATNYVEKGVFDPPLYNKIEFENHLIECENHIVK